MARSIHPYFAPRDMRGAANVAPTPTSAEPSRAMAGMLLAAVVAAVLVVADQLVDTWADGNLLLVWVALWSVAFAALALLARPIRLLARALKRAFAAWSEGRAQAHADAAMWRLAQQDARLMRDLQLAIWHGERES